MCFAHNRLTLVLLLLGPLLAHGATWHVSPDVLPNVDLAQQKRSINDAAAVARAGDLVLIHSGVYRESVVVSASGTAARPIRFEAAPNANVTVSGTDILIEWRDEGGGVFSTPWPHRFVTWTETQAHPGDEFHRLVGRPEQV